MKKLINTAVLVLVLAALLCLMVSCVGGGTDVSVTGITLNQKSLSLRVGDSATLVGMVLPSDANDKSVIWSSSNTSVVTVEDGRVTAVGEGSASVTVTTNDGGYTAECSVTVVPKQNDPPAVINVSGISLDRASLNIEIGSQITLQTTVAPSNATNKNVIWTSSSSDVASVNGGVVSALSEGTATIIATTEDGGYTATCQVTVTPVAQITVVQGVRLDKTSEAVLVGETTQLTATVNPESATNRNVIWSSSNEEVATVSAGGLVTAVAEGTATITVTTVDGSYRAECVVTVRSNGTVENGAPEYLGVFISKTVPGASTPQLLARKALMRSAKEEIFAAVENWFYNSMQDTPPPLTVADAYGVSGETVYVGILLNNPNQCTILSMNLNGVKYQVGGALRSYFYPDGTNCVFVELTLPEDTYVEKSYTVEQVQYVMESNAISGNGKDIMLGNNDTTVTVAMPYRRLPTATVNIAEATVGFEDALIEIDITDPYGVIAESGAVIKAFRYYEGIGEQYPLAVGNNTAAFNYMKSDTEYTIVVAAYLDLRDGNGIKVVELARETVKTRSYFSVNASGGYHTYTVDDNGTSRKMSGAEISLEAELSGKAATRISVVDALSGTVYYECTDPAVLGAFNTTGKAVLESPLILNNKEQEVRIYYSDHGYESTVVKTPALTIPLLAGSGMVEVDGRYQIFYENNSMYDKSTQQYIALPEYADYGNITVLYDEVIYDSEGDQIGTTEHRYTSTYATSTAAFSEYLFVLVDSSAVLTDPEIYTVVWANKISSIKDRDDIYYDTVDNNSVRFLSIAGIEKDFTLGSLTDIPDADSGIRAVFSEVQRDVLRLYLVDRDYREYQQMTTHHQNAYVYAPNSITTEYYMEFTVDLNDGTGEHTVKFQYEIPKVVNTWKDAPVGGVLDDLICHASLSGTSEFYSYCYDRKEFADYTEDAGKYDYTVTIEEPNKVTVRYNALSYPDNLFLEAEGIASDSHGIICIPGQKGSGNGENEVPKYNSDVNFFYSYILFAGEDRASHMQVGPTCESFLPDIADTALDPFVIGAHTYGEVKSNTGRPTGSPSIDGSIEQSQYSIGAYSYLISKDPVFMMSDEEKARMAKSIADLDKEWFDAYYNAILNGGGKAIGEVLPPDYIEWKEITFYIDMEKYPDGTYRLTSFSRDDVVYHTYEQYYAIQEHAKQYDFYDMTVRYDYAQHRSSEKFDMCRETVTVPENIRMEDGEIIWEGTTNARTVSLEVTYLDSEGEKKAVISGAPDEIEGKLHSFVFDNKIEGTISCKPTFIAEAEGIRERYSAEGNSFVYAPRKVDEPKVQFVLQACSDSDGDSAVIMLSYIAPKEVDQWGMAEGVFAYSINGGEYMTELADGFCAYLDGQEYKPYRFKLGDTVSFKGLGNGYNSIDGDVTVYTLTLHGPEVSFDEGNGVLVSGTDCTTLFGFDFNQQPGKLGPYIVSYEYRIDDGSIVEGGEHSINGKFLFAGEKYSVRYVLKPGNSNPYSSEFFNGNDAYYSEWVSAIAPEIGDFSYTLNDDGVTITVTAYNSRDINAVIPSSIDGKTVTGIGYFAFANNPGVETVTIPATVTSINNYAFCDRDYTDHPGIKELLVDAENTVFASYDGIIYSKDFTAIKFVPANIEGEVHLADGLLKLEGLKNKPNVTAVYVPSSVTSKENDAFSGTPIKVYSIGCEKMLEGVSGVEHIIFDYSNIVISNYNAYKNALIGVKTITLTENVATVNSGAFDSATSLEDLYINSKNLALNGTVSDTTVGILGTSGGSEKGCTVIFSENTESISRNILYGSTRLTKVILNLSSTVSMANRAVGDYSFANCTALKEVQMSSSIIKIGAYSFSGCVALDSINTENIVVIGDHAFSGTAIENVELPSLYTLGASAFRGSMVKSVVLGNDLAAVGDYAFYACEMLETVSLGSGVSTIGVQAFCNCYSLSSINIPDGVQSLGKQAFKNCQSLTAITIPESLTTFGKEVFIGCEKLYEVVNLSTNVFTVGTTDFGYVAYYARVILTSTEQPSKFVIKDGFKFYVDGSEKPLLVAYVGTEESITLPQDYEGREYVISPYAFARNRYIVSVTAGDNIVELPASAFESCPNLTTVNMSNVTAIGSYAFASCAKLESISAPKLITIDSRAFYECKKLSSEDMTALKSIGAYAFYGCTSLEGLSSDVITSVGASALEGCTSFKNFDFSRVTSIGSNALKGVSIPDRVIDLRSCSIILYSKDPFGNDAGAFAGVIMGMNTTYGSRVPNIYIYGEGTAAEQKASVTLQNVTPTLYYYSETKPSMGAMLTDNYWHFDSDGNVVIWTA